jgi:hypothetical protein
MRTIDEAIEWGRGQVSSPSQSWQGKCQTFVRSCDGVGAWALTAYDAWLRIPAAHRSDAGSVHDAPRGAALYFRHASGDPRPGHVVLATKSNCLSNDIYRKGMIDCAPRDIFASHWGMTYLGWSLWTPSGEVR